MRTACRPSRACRVRAAAFVGQAGRRDVLGERRRMLRRVAYDRQVAVHRQVSAAWHATAPWTIGVSGRLSERCASVEAGDRRMSLRASASLAPRSRTSSAVTSTGSRWPRCGRSRPCSMYGERGVIDVLAWHAATRTALVIELKTVIADVNELIGNVDRKRRLAPRVAAERGWDARAVACWVIVAEGRSNRRRLAAHAAVLRAAFPEDGHVVRSWLRQPDRPIAALSFWQPPGGAETTPRIRNAGRQRARPGTPAGSSTFEWVAPAASAAGRLLTYATRRNRSRRDVWSGPTGP